MPILTHCDKIFHSIFVAVINWLNKQMNELMLGRPPLTAPVGFPPRTSAQPQGALSSSAGHTLSSIRPSPSGVILQSQRHSLPLPTTTTGTAGLLGMPHPQLQHRVSKDHLFLCLSLSLSTLSPHLLIVKAISYHLQADHEFSLLYHFSFLCSLSLAVLLPSLKPLLVKVGSCQLHGRYWALWPAKRTSDNTRSYSEALVSRKVPFLFHLHCLPTLSLLIVQELQILPVAVKVRYVCTLYLSITPANPDSCTDDMILQNPNLPPPPIPIMHCHNNIR